MIIFDLKTQIVYEKFTDIIKIVYLATVHNFKFEKFNSLS